MCVELVMAINLRCSWNGNYMMVLRPEGEILAESSGTMDILKKDSSQPVESI